MTTNSIDIKRRALEITTHEQEDSIQKNNNNTCCYRFTKRFYISINLLKLTGIKTGDLCILKPIITQNQINQLNISKTTSTSNSIKESNIQFAFGIAWPSTNIKDDETIAVSTDHLLNANLQIGDLVNIIPLPPILSTSHIGPGRGIRIPEAKKITLEEITNPDKLFNSKYNNILDPLIQHESEIPLNLRDLKPVTVRMWESFVREVLVDRKYLAINHYVSIPFANSLRLFSIQDIQPTTPVVTNSPFKSTPPRPSKPTSSPLSPSPSSPSPSSSSPPSLELFVITRETQLEFTDSPTDQKQNHSDTSPSSEFHSSSFLNSQSTIGDGYDAIGGLDSQVEQIRELIELPMTRPDLYSHFGLTPPRGILLHGPPGTGKTLLASIIAGSIKCTVLRLSTETMSSAYHGEAEQGIYDLFLKAKSNSPSIIIIDEIDGLFPSRESGGEVDRRVVGALLSCMDGIDDKIPSSSLKKLPHHLASSAADSNLIPRVIVVATTNRPHTLDPALRRPGRFDREFEIGIPNSSARLKILKVILTKIPNNLSEENIKSIAAKAHGFVGADLVSLIREAGMIAIKRSIELTTKTPSISIDQLKLEPADTGKAFIKIRPSGMRELYIETPKVTWGDIGGQIEIKQRLIEAIEWPLKYPSTFQRLGIRPARGILLYGPPGCSKTLIAKALAFESHMNFIALKGSDVFQKYLGESEKSIRDLFSKARAAAPSIVFLDEIDSIAMARGGDDDHGGSNNSVGDRVLTSLLVELDGVEELNGVLVLAATNRPDVIDPALMRPGRIDRILYVGLPDLISRIEIFKINFKKMSVSDHVQIEELASLTEGYTGAEIVSICQDAAINAMHRDLNVQHIEHEDFLDSISKFPSRTDPKMINFLQNWSIKSGLHSA